MLDLRDRFALPHANAVELRAFTHGLQPKTVPAMMRRFVEDWQTRGVDAWNRVENHWRPESGEQVGWWSLPTYLGDHFVAPLLGASAGTCILQPSVHHTVQLLMSAEGLFEGRRREVVVTEAAFPSVLHSAQRWAPMLDLDVKVVSSNASGFVDQEAVLEAISERTALVALAHVGFATGERLPDAFLRRVAARAHDAGALFLVDGYHAAGAFPVDVQALGADVYVGGLLKLASGSAGNAFVYVRPDLDLRPRLGGWFADADPFGFEPSPQYHPEGRRRFLGGTTNVASFYHAVEGVRVLLDVGLDNVRADSLAKTDLAIERAEAAGLHLRSPREHTRRGAMLVFEVEHADRLCAWLKDRGIYTDTRRGRLLRMAPWLWNTADGMYRTFSAMEEALASGVHLAAWRAEAAGPVT